MGLEQPADVVDPTGVSNEGAPMRRPVLLALALSTTIAVGGPSIASAGSDGSATAKASVAKKKKRCDPNYKGRCLKPNVSDYDCAGGSGNGPYYVRGPVRVVGNDHYRLDSDRDGIGCES
jgi:hypothetical protein